MYDVSCKLTYGRIPIDAYYIVNVIKSLYYIIYKKSEFKILHILITYERPFNIYLQKRKKGNTIEHLILYQGFDNATTFYT